jgi:hypothetical protein
VYVASVFGPKAWAGARGLRIRIIYLFADAKPASWREKKINIVEHCARALDLTDSIFAQGVTLTRSSLLSPSGDVARRDIQEDANSFPPIFAFYFFANLIPSN